jgi:hypothetical protein
MALLVAAILSAVMALVSGAGAAGPTLKKECADASLAGPEVLESIMTKPGSSGGAPQYVKGSFLYSLMPDACKDNFRRFASYLVQIKDKGRNRWRNMTIDGRRHWARLQIDETGEFKDRYRQGQAQGDFLLGPSGHGVTADKNGYYYNKNCRPVRAFLRTTVVKNRPRKVHDIKGQPGLYRLVYPKVKEKFKRVAVTVLGKCARSGTRHRLAAVLLVARASMDERGKGEAVLAGIDGDLHLARGSVCSASGREHCY